MQTAVTSAPLIGVPGQLSTLQSVSDSVVRSATSEEASTSIPFGRLVVRGTATDGVKLPAAQEDKIAGVVVFAQNYAKSDGDHVGQLDANGLTPGTTFDLLRTGSIFVLATDTCAPGDAVLYQAETTGGDAAVHPLGSFCKTPESGKTVDISAFAEWLSGGDVGDIVEIFIDVSNAALADPTA